MVKPWFPIDLSEILVKNQNPCIVEAKEELVRDLWSSLSKSRGLFRSGLPNPSGLGLNQ